MAVDKAEYDIEAYAEKIRRVLEHLQENATPGERTGKGNRTDVVRAVRDDIESVVALGYTMKQIAAAITEGDVFKILPKSITQILNESNKPAKAGSSSAKRAGTSAGMSQNKTTRGRNTVTKNKQPTSDDGGHAVPADVEEPKGLAPEVRQAPAGNRSGPRPDRD